MQVRTGGDGGPGFCFAHPGYALTPEILKWRKSEIEHACRLHVCGQQHVKANSIRRAYA
jgi:hypothetical protein